MRRNNGVKDVFTINEVDIINNSPHDVAKKYIANATRIQVLNIIFDHFQIDIYVDGKPIDKVKRLVALNGLCNLLEVTVIEREKLDIMFERSETINTARFIVINSKEGVYY